MLESDGTTGELSQEEMRTVCLHEFGHAIGLWGHSPHTDDVCHAMATAQHPTQRDINTLLKIYETPLHTAQHDVAIDLLKKEVQRNPRLPRPHYLLGAVYFDKGDMTSAITNFQNCLKIDPNYEPAREKLIQAYQKTGQSNQALRQVEQRVKSQQGHRSLRDTAESYNRLGTLHYRQGDTEKAIEAFEKALKRSPHHKTAKQNLNQLYRQEAFNALKRRAFDEAEPHILRKPSVSIRKMPPLIESWETDMHSPPSMPKRLHITKRHSSSHPTMQRRGKTSYSVIITTA